MSTIKLEFPAGDKHAARVFAQALLDYTGGASAAPEPEAERKQPAPSVFEESDRQQADDGANTDRTPDAGADETDGSASALDLHGVPFDDSYCGQATEPFYSSGKRSGQWKKKRGVTEDQYDAWYAEQLKAAGGEQTEAPPETVDTRAAFGGQSQEQQPPAGNSNAPATGGDLMGWVSEMQAAGHLTQSDVDNAYHTAGLGIGDIFAADQAVQRRNVATIHGILAHGRG